MSEYGVSNLENALLISCADQLPGPTCVGAFQGLALGFFLVSRHIVVANLRVYANRGRGRPPLPWTSAMAAGLLPLFFQTLGQLAGFARARSRRRWSPRGCGKQFPPQSG